MPRFYRNRKQRPVVQKGKGTNSKYYYSRRIRRKRINAPQYLAFKRSYVYNVTSTGSNQFVSINPTLGDLSSYAEITELFEMYRINRVKIRYIPAITSMDMQNISTGQPNPSAMMYVTTHSRRGVSADYNTENEFLEDPNFFCKPAMRPWSVYYTPNILYQAYESLSSTGYGPKYKQWLTTNDHTVPHYGFAFALTDWGPGFPSDTIKVGRFVITLYMQAKQVH